MSIKRSKKSILIEKVNVFWLFRSFPISFNLFWSPVISFEFFDYIRKRFNQFGLDDLDSDVRPKLIQSPKLSLDMFIILVQIVCSLVFTLTDLKNSYCWFITRLVTLKNWYWKVCMCNKLKCETHLNFE